MFAGFLNETGLDMVEVAYREDNLAYQDLGEGRIDIAIGTLTGVLPLVHAGKVRPLAVTNKTRCPLAPDVPTAIEAGYPALTFDGLAGFFGPSDMPGEQRERIAADVEAVAGELTDRFAAFGQVASGSTPAGFAAAIEEQRAKIASIVERLHAHPTR